MKLYGYWRSSSAWRVRIALAYKNIDYEYVPVLLQQEDGAQHAASYAAKNPMLQVPVLEIARPEESFRVAQSMAIIEYLEEVCPEPTLLPGKPAARARARELAEIINSGIQPLQNMAVLVRVRKLTDEAEMRAWARNFIGRGLEALEQKVEKLAGRYLMGDELSIADVFLVPQLYNAERYDLDLASYPTLVRVRQSCELLEPFTSSHPDRQPDAPRR